MKKTLKGKFNSALIVAAVVLGVVLLAGKTGPTPAWAHEVPQPCDFTTGGGFVFRDDGARVNFGIVGGCKHEGFYGHVNVVDHSITPSAHLNGRVTAYFDPLVGTPGYRDLCGIGRLRDGSEVRFRIRTKDNGEPGGLDRFGIKVTSGGTLVYLLSVRELGPPGETGGGGNIQLHKGNKSNTGPAVPPSDFIECGGDDSGLGM
jgi:hypothetical protein